MKKYLSWILAALMLISFSACYASGSCSLYATEEEPVEDTVEEEYNLNWGVELSVENADNHSLTLICTQSGAELNGELSTGSPYWIEMHQDGQWITVEETPSEYERAWTAEAYLITMNGNTEFDIDWEWIYGELPAGHYRIGKEFIQLYSPGDFDRQNFFAEFEIE